MREVDTLDDVVAEVRSCAGLFVRWSRGPGADDAGVSRDGLTGARLPGLCANPLAVEPWWGDRPLREWVARRLCDYAHLAESGARPWLLTGEETGRGPDNEPLVRCRAAVAWVGPGAVREAEAVLGLGAREWGPLERTSGGGGDSVEGAAADPPADRAS